MLDNSTRHDARRYEYMVMDKVRYKHTLHCSIRGMVSELEQMQAIGRS